jgi:acetyl esterase/lipase
MSDPADPADTADPRMIPIPAAPAVARTTAYGPNPSQVYDVRLPTRAPHGTTVVVIHGGFWRAEFDRTHAAGQAQAFADNGFHVAVLEYRRVGMAGGGWPGTFQDVMAGVAAVRADPELPDRVVIVGHSAGGHLAALVASQRDAHGVAGAVCLAGCVDLALSARMSLGDGAAPALMGGDPADLPAAYAEADPAVLTPAVPVVLLHGADDQVVPPEVSLSYADRVRRSDRAHAEVRRTVIPACDHFGLIDPEHPAFAVVLRAVRSLAP